jgi:hypothetical protein
VARLWHALLSERSLQAGVISLEMRALRLHPFAEPRLYLFAGPGDFITDRR